MAQREIRYFTPEGQQARYPRPLKNADFAERFPGVKGLRYDSFSRMVGYLEGDSKTPVPLVRKVDYKTARPSLHVCDARCMGGKPGGRCECSCGGANHGAAA